MIFNILTRIVQHFPAVFNASLDRLAAFYACEGRLLERLSKQIVASQPFRKQSPLHQGRPPLRSPSTRMKRKAIIAKLVDDCSIETGFTYVSLGS